MCLPNGPRVIPFLHQLQWRNKFLEFLEFCVQKYGSNFTIKQVRALPYVVISHPQAIKEIFTAPPGYFHSGQANTAFKPLLGRHSLLLLDGIAHQHHRKFLMPLFHGEYLREYGKIICESTHKHINQWQHEQPFVIRPAVQTITLEIILRVVFGIEDQKNIGKALNTLINAFISPLPGKAFSFLRVKKLIDQVIYEQITEKRSQANSPATNVLSLLLTLRDEQGAFLTDEEIRDELITLIMAGFETTTVAVLWSIYWVAKLPDVREKLYAEISQIVSISTAKIAQLPYLTAVCQESLRMYSITCYAFDRIVQQPIEIMGWKFEPGTRLSPCPYLTHQREDIYPEPKRFRPERFLEKDYSAYEYYPFGGGNRRCIGAAFAFYEMKLILATIFAHLHLSVNNSDPVRPVPRGITLDLPQDLEMSASLV